MNEMNITSAQYVQDAVSGENTSITIVVGSETWSVPNDSPGNRHYDEILRQVEAGTLTIAEAE
jgi:hypothetical protein